MIRNVVVWRYDWYMKIKSKVKMLKGKGVRIDK